MTGKPVATDREWSTFAFPEAERMGRWTEVVSDHMTEMVVSTDDPGRYAARWRQFGLGPVDLNFIVSGRQRCLRSDEMTARGLMPTYELVHVRSGALTVHSQSGTDRVPAGSFALLCNEFPYEFSCHGPTLALNIHCDDVWLRRWLDSPQDLIRASHEQRMIWGAPLASLLTAIDADGLDAPALPRSAIADQLGALMRLIGRPSAEPGRPGRRDLLARIRRAMRDHLGTIGLSPQTIAGECGISKRYLHLLLAGDNSTFSGELMAMRLDRAHQMLANPACRSWSLTQIGLECGFVDQSHFSRRFGKKFGTAPSSFRKIAAS